LTSCQCETMLPWNVGAKMRATAKRKSMEPHHRNISLKARKPPRGRPPGPGPGETLGGPRRPPGRSNYAQSRPMLGHKSRQRPVKRCNRGNNVVSARIHCHTDPWKQLKSGPGAQHPRPGRGPVDYFVQGVSRLRRPLRPPRRGTAAGVAVTIENNVWKIICRTPPGPVDMDIARNRTRQERLQGGKTSNRTTRNRLVFKPTIPSDSHPFCKWTCTDGAEAVAPPPTMAELLLLKANTPCLRSRRPAQRLPPSLPRAREAP
jgi:hypothetical protein